MKKLLLLPLFLSGSILGFAATPAGAPTAPATTVSGVPDAVASGFLTYMKEGYATAVEFWSKGSSLNLDSAAKTALNKSLSDEENIAGTFVAPEIIRVVNLSPSSLLVYIFGKYQRGGLYMCFACYKTSDKWLVTSVASDADPAKVLPTNILAGL